MNKTAYIVLLFVALAGGYARAVNFVPSPLKAITNYVFTLPACGPNGIRGKLMSISSPSGAVLRAEDRAFLAEAAAERRAFLTRNAAFGEQDLSSQWRISTRDIYVDGAWSCTNSSYTNIGEPTKLSTTHITFLEDAEIAAALGADVEATTNLTIKFEGIPRIATITNAYNTLGKFRYKNDDDYAYLARSWKSLHTTQVSGSPRDYENGTSSNPLEGSNVTHITEGEIFSLSVSVHKRLWNRWRASEDYQSWIADGSGTRREITVEQLSLTALSAATCGVMRVAIARDRIVQAAAVLRIYLNHSAGRADYAVAVPATVVPIGDMAVLSFSVDYAAIVDSVLRAAGRSWPTPQSVESTLADVELEAPPNPPSETIGGSYVCEGNGVSASEHARFYLMGWAYVLDIVPAAIHPEVKNQ